jgi:hypothetical protein
LHTDFEPVLQSELASAKRALRFGVVDAERDLKWSVDHRALAPDGTPAPRGSLYDLASDPGEARDLAPDGRLPAAYAELALLPGLRTQPLGDPLGDSSPEPGSRE